MKKFIRVLILATVFAEIINVQAQEIINGDKILTGDIRFNKGIYYGVNNATLPTAFNQGFTKVAVVYDQPSNPNLPTVNIGSCATVIHDQGVAVVKSGGGEPRMSFFRSAGRIYAPTNVVSGYASDNIMFMNYYNGAYRRGANIFSQVISPISSSTFPSSTLTFNVRMPNNVSTELDPVLRLMKMVK